MDADIAKQSQKFLTKQGLKFKLNTKVTAGEVHDAGVKIHVEAAKGGKEETVSSDSECRCYTQLTDPA
jgi:dihydrolipoamide dehydrogenase